MLPNEPPTVPVGRTVLAAFFAFAPEALVEIAAATADLIFGMLGRKVLIIGGTNDTVRTGWLRALSASSMNRSSSEAGMSVLTIAVLALAMSPNLSTTSFGLSWCSIAFITHFCRAIRE